MKFFKKLFSKPRNNVVEYNTKIEQFIKAGIIINSNISFEEIKQINGEVENWDTQEIAALYETLGFCEEREKRISSNSYTLDFECISDSGDYSTILSMLSNLTNNEFNPTNIVDYVNEAEDEIVWLEFEFQNKFYHFDLIFEDDWLDENLFLELNKVLAVHNIANRFTLFPTGQSSVISYLSLQQIANFEEITSLQLYLPMYS